MIGSCWSGWSASITQTLKESAEALGYLERRRAGASGADRAVPPRVCEPDAWATGCRRRTARRAPRSAAGCSGSGCSAPRGMSISDRVAGDPDPRCGRAACVQLYGRKIRDDLRPGTPLHLYLPGAHRGVFNRQALKASREIIVCESLIDALSFWCHGPAARDRGLRRRGVHRRAPGRVQGARHGAGADRL